MMAINVCALLDANGFMRKKQCRKGITMNKMNGNEMAAMKNEGKAENRIGVKSIALVAMMAAVICILGPWSVPIGPVPISLTNFAIFLTLYVLGWKRGTWSFVIYFLLGAVGLPVFSGFSGGAGKIMGPTGGYIVGFLFMALIAGAFIQKFSGNKLTDYIFCYLGMLLGTAVCYLFGTVWFVQVFADSQTPYTYSAALAVCVYPFIIGDLIKMAVALILGQQLRSALRGAGLI